MCCTNDVIWLDKHLILEAVSKEIFPVDVVLDVGTGVRPQGFFPARIHICVEPHSAYAEKLVAMTVFRSELFPIVATWNTLLPLLPDSSVDSIFALDFIEHLEKDEGVLFLAEAIRVARRQVVVFTPYGFYPQDYSESDEKDRWGLDGTQWQIHKSGWMPEDFGSGWKLLCCNNFHDMDQFGQNLSIPIGAIWAIHSVDSDLVGNRSIRKKASVLVQKCLFRAISWLRKIC